MEVNILLYLKTGCKTKQRGIKNMKLEDMVHFLTAFSHEEICGKG